MAYTKIVFQNSPSTATPLNAENLNHMDDQIALNDQRLTEIETSYVKSFNGRKGEVTPQSGDYNIGQIAPLTGAQVGQVPVVVNHGTEEDPELVFEMGAGGGGGHSIIDSSGNTMPQEDAMQFADAFVSDDDVNGRTIVENIKEVASADYSSETEDGMYLIPDGEGAVIEPASDDKVEVTADGNTTYAQLLKDLNADITKLTDMSVILVGGQIFNFAYSGSEYWFTCTNIDEITQKMTFHRLRRLSNGNWSCVKIDTTNVTTDNSSDLIPNGTVITLYYGNKKAVVDLQTTANRCWMGDGETNVEDYVTANELTFGNSSSLSDGVNTKVVAQSDGYLHCYVIDTSTRISAYGDSNEQKQFFQVTNGVAWSINSMYVRKGMSIWLKASGGSGGRYYFSEFN